MLDFKKLKANSGKASLEKLNTELQKLSSKQQGQKDDRFWYPAVDKAGNGYAVIRFLPATDNESNPFIRVFDHGFQGPTGSWYFENSLTTLGKQDPVSEHNTKLWNSGSESDKELARKYKRKLSFIANVYIITDKQNPENEGKVMLFKFGKKLFDKLNEAMNPEFEDETPLNPFDLWEGANFIMKIRNVEGYRNYDRSEFAKPAVLAKDDEMEDICNKMHSLQTFLAPDQFKSYEELKAKFEKVLGLDGSPAVARTKAAALVEEAEDIVQPVRTQTAKPPSFAATDEEDETAKWFESLAEDK
jgi:hypothetical protein